MGEAESVERDAEYLAKMHELKGVRDILVNPEKTAAKVAEYDSAIKALSNPYSIGTLHYEDYTLKRLIHDALDHKKALEIYRKLGPDVYFSGFDDTTGGHDRVDVLDNLTVSFLVSNLHPAEFLKGFFKPTASGSETLEEEQQYDHLVNPELNNVLAELGNHLSPLGDREDWTPSDVAKALIDSEKAWAIKKAEAAKQNTIEVDASMPSNIDKQIDNLIEHEARPNFEAHADEIHAAALASMELDGDEHQKKD